jgi:hypothetical protein
MNDCAGESQHQFNRLTTLKFGRKAHDTALPKKKKEKIRENLDGLTQDMTGRIF